MPKFRFAFNLLACLAIITGVVALNSAPASAAGPSISRIESSGTSHFKGSAFFGLVDPAAMEATTALPTPYTYGQYAVIWNVSNPTRKSISKYGFAMYQCDTKEAAEELNNSANVTGCTQMYSRLRDPDANQRTVTEKTFSEVFGSPDDHGKWIRAYFRIIFTDGTQLWNWSNSRLYVHDGARTEVPVATTRGADGQSVPQNTAMNMEFNPWQSVATWQSQSPLVTRSARVYRCSSLPTDASSVVVSNSSTPSGCTLLVVNTVLDTNTRELALNFTSGAKGSYIYAIDTIVAVLKQSSASPVVQLQKRSIFTTYDPAELPTGPSPSAGGVVQPGANVDPLRNAGINTGTAPVVSNTGQVTSNGITAVINANGRYKRGKQRRSITVRVQPNNKSRGAIVAALVSSSGGVETVHLTKNKNVRNGKARWRWRFPDALPRGRYKIYVSFTPADATVSPMTITKRVRLR